MSSLQIHDSYTISPPSVENIFEIIDGWNGVKDPQKPIVNNAIDFKECDRVQWTDKIIRIRDKTILELGPHEARDTWLLERAQAKKITAIEASSKAYLKCLITKEIMGLKRAKFLRGDFIPFLERNEQTWDIIFASGVLYHMTQPLRLLELIAERTNAFYLWTHCINDQILESNDQRLNAFEEKVEITWKEKRIQLYPRPYTVDHHKKSNFAGGIYPNPMWMKKEEILDCIKELGFNHIEIEKDDSDHYAGPTISLLAQRR